MARQNFCLKSVLCKLSVCLSVALSMFVLLGGVFSPVYADLGERALENFRNRVTELKEKAAAGIAIGADELLFLEEMQQQLSSENQRLRSSDRDDMVRAALLDDVNAVRQLSFYENEDSEKRDSRPHVTPRSDVTPPQLTSFSITPSVVNVSAGSQTVTFSASAQDDLSGVKEMVIWFDKTMPNGYSLVGVYGSYDDPWDDGSSAKSLTFLQSTASGTYNITSIDITDNMNNERTYYPADLTAKGFPTSLTVEGGGTGDTTPPQLTSFSITPSVVNVSAGSQVVTFSASAQDDISGVKEMVIWFDKTMPNGYSLVGIYGSYDDPWDDGSSAKALTFTSSTAPGTYSITSIDITDNMNNERTYYPADLTAKGFPTSLTVQSGGTGDTTAPQLTSFSITPSVVNVSAGSQTVTFSASAQDDISGVKEVVIWFDKTMPNGYSLVGVYGSYDDPWDDGSCAKALTFPQYAATGTYTVTSVDVTDNMNNKRTYYPADLSAKGFPTSFLVETTQTSTRIIGLSGSLAFGSVTVGTTKQLTLTVSNTGNSVLSVSSITYPSGFSGNWSGTIAAGSSQSVTVTFAPTAVQVYSGAVTVSSDKTAGTNTLQISGTGTSASTRVIALPTSLAFGDVQVATTKTMTLLIQNTGNSALAISSISYPAGFTGSWNGTIAAGGSQSVTVTFAPTAAQVYSGALTVSSDKTGGTNTLQISGAGTLVPDRIINLNGDLNFGNVTVNLTKQLNFTVSNSGNAVLTVSSITYPSGFTGNWTGGTIAANASVTVAVTFKPTAPQLYSGAITVNSDKTSGTNTLQISGTGTSLPNRIIALSSDLNFGDVTVGLTKQMMFTVSNTGDSTLTVNSITYPSGFTGNWTGGTIAANASVTVAVTFKPTAAQSYSGMLTVSSDKTGGTDTLQISGTGTSLPNRIVNLNGNLDFGNVTAGSSKQQTFIVSNSGDATLTVSSISYPSGFTGNWNGGTIAPSGSVTVTVTFAPTAAQSYSGTLTVNSDKTDGTNMLPVSGTGTQLTRLIGLTGNLAFGNVNVNMTKQLTFTVGNTGNSILTVSSIAYPAGFTGNWNSGTIAAGASQTVTVTFNPVAAQSYSGTVTVNSDKTSGTNTLQLSGTGMPQQVSYSISGYVKDSGNAGMSGVTMTFNNSGGTATTDSSGFYSKTFTAAWTGIATPSKSGYSFSPASRSYSNTSADQISQNYSGGIQPTAFRIWIDKNGNRAYDSGEGVSAASVRVNNETSDRGVTDSQGIIALQNVGNDAKIYAQKNFYSMSNVKAVDANFGTRSKNPYYAGSVNGKMYEFVMASDIMAADGSYSDFPGQGKTLANASKDAQGNMLVQLVHPKIGWNLIVVFEQAQSAAFYDQIKSGFRSYADYMYNYTDGYSVVKNVVLVKGAYLNSAQWNYCDVQVKNSEWPNANPFGNRTLYRGEQGHIRMGKEWAIAAPDGYNWYSTLGHESGHYLLGFGDEYMNGNYTKGANVAWTYREQHSPAEFPVNYGIMQSQYGGVHEMSDPTDYYPRAYSSSINVDWVTHQFMTNKGQSCWAFFKSYYQNDIKQQMALQGFSDAFFNNLIVPPHTTGSYPGSDRSKRNYPATMNRDSVNIIEWNYSGRRSSPQNEDVFDALAVVVDETGNPVAGADVWLVSSDCKNFQGKSDRKGIVKCGSLLVGKQLEAYFEGRKAETVIDAVKESYVLILPKNRISPRDDAFSGMVVSAKPDSSDPNRLTITASGDSIGSAPAVTLSQSFAYSQNLSMSASGADEYSGIAACQYNSGILEVSSGGNESVSPFEIFSTEIGPVSGYYAPNGELEMAYSPTTFTGSGSFVIVNSSMPAPMNNGMIQVGNVYSFGFSDTVTSVQNVILNIRLSEGGVAGNPNLYGWDIQAKTWNLIPGGESGLRTFSISLESMDYNAYALFTLPQANDPNPPESVTGFTASTGTSLWSVNLQWTTPDSDVFLYDIRFNTVPVTEDNWDKCISVGNSPTPAAPGTLQSFTAEMPDPGVAYYFGIIAVDESGNQSSLASLSSPVTSQATDADGDGISDLWEASRGLDTNVNDAQNDDDGDGLTTLQEYQYNTDPQHSDTDRDVYSDGDEISQGTDPTDYTSYPKLSASDTVPGDLDCDGSVTLSDAVIALKITSAIDLSSEFCMKDVNGDGKIGIEEAVYALRIAAGLKE